MTDFEVRYNAVEQANLLMMQRLILEIAIMKGDEGPAWIDKFRNAVVSEVVDTQASDGGQRPAAITAMARSVVENVALMSKNRLTQLKEDGIL
jgi:hypothetical protein